MITLKNFEYFLLEGALDKNELHPVETYQQKREFEVVDDEIHLFTIKSDYIEYPKKYFFRNMQDVANFIAGVLGLSTFYASDWGKGAGYYNPRGSYYIDYEEKAIRISDHDLPEIYSKYYENTDIDLRVSTSENERVFKYKKEWEAIEELIKKERKRISRKYKSTDPLQHEKLVEIIPPLFNQQKELYNRKDAWIYPPDYYNIYCKKGLELFKKHILKKL